MSVTSSQQTVTDNSIDVSAMGFDAVSSEVSCVITRFEVRSCWSLFRFLYEYSRVKRDSKQISGLIVTLFSMENLRTYYTISVWADSLAIGDFNTRVLSHITAARYSIKALRYDSDGARLWSGRFLLVGRSHHNINWTALDSCDEMQASGT